MSDLINSKESNHLSKRFRRLLDSDENKEGNERIGENQTVFVDINQSLSEIETNALENDKHVVPVESMSSGSIDSPAEELNRLNQNRIESDVNSDIKTIPLNSEKVFVETTPARVLPAIDEYGMPIIGKTQKIINPVSYSGSDPYNQSYSSVNRYDIAIPQQKPDHAKNKSLNTGKTTRKRNRRTHLISLKQGIGCLLRMLLLACLTGIVLMTIGGSFAMYEYYKIAATLPDVADLQQRASAFETTRIFDRNGNLLYEILDPSAGRRTFIKLDKISPYMVAATIATEDKSFYSHPGFDWTAIARAFCKIFKKERLYRARQPSHNN
jgi:hypothetical protein